MGNAGEMLDAQAKAEYSRRTAEAELREQLEEARELNQLEPVDQLEKEIEAVGRELSRVVGLDGASRREDGHPEYSSSRARGTSAFSGIKMLRVTPPATISC